MLTEDTLQDIVDRIVKVADPDRIMLFGSAARGEMNSRSDVDLIVIKGGDYNHYKLIGLMHREMIEVEESVDIILVRPEDVERYKDSPYLIIKSALEDGREIYPAPTPAR